MADPKFLKYVDEHQEDYIKTLAKAVSIPSFVPFVSHIPPEALQSSDPCSIFSAPADVRRFFSVSLVTSGKWMSSTTQGSLIPLSLDM
jgi:hypothetical protein